jgi:ATP-dependent Clp protease ATP-binding subunit ClpB
MSEAEKQKAVNEAMRTHFRPEFLNRIDEVVMFKALGEAQIAGIVKVQLNLVKERVKAKKINIDFTDDAVQLLARKGYDPIYGARPLKRVIQNDLLNPLSKAIIAGDVRSGDSIIIEVRGQGLNIVKKS